MLLVTVLNVEKTLIEMNKEIKNSLMTEGMDIDKCLAVMQELESLHVSAVILKKNPDIVATLKKVL